MAVRLANAAWGQSHRHGARPRLLQLAENGPRRPTPWRSRAVLLFVELASGPGRQAVSVRAGQRLRGHDPRTTGRLRRGRPRERPHAASGTPADAPDHAPDEDPRRRRAGRFPTRDRWFKATLSGDLQNDPFTGVVFVFRNRRATALKLLMYDGQGFWLCHKRLSQGRFPWWPAAGDGGAQRLAAHQLAVLLSAGDPTRTGAACSTGRWWGRRPDRP